MPKKARTPEEIQEVKRKILNMALELINKDGYDDLSLRKLAARLHITATNIYQYYASKDELYLAVLTEGFAFMYARMYEGYQAGNTPMERLKGVLGEYIRFGIEQANFYNIMFVWNVPKYNDYIGTESEQVALIELNTALQVWDLLKMTVSESQLLSKSSIEDKEIITLELLCNIHGLVSLCNSRIIDYTFESRKAEIDQEFIDRFIDMIICRPYEKAFPNSGCKGPFQKKI